MKSSQVKQALSPREYDRQGVVGNLVLGYDGAVLG